MNDNWMKAQSLKAEPEGRQRKAERDAWRQARREAAEREQEGSQLQPQDVKRPPRPLGRSVLGLPSLEFEVQLAHSPVEFRPRLEAARLEAAIKDEAIQDGEAQ